MDGIRILVYLATGYTWPSDFWYGGVRVSFRSKRMPKSFAESRNEIWKFCKDRDSREGIGFLLLKMTKHVFKEENRKPIPDAHVEILFSVFWRRRWALYVVIVSEEALSDREINIFGFIVDGYQKKSGTLKTSPWGTSFWIGSCDDFRSYRRSDKKEKVKTGMQASMQDRYPSNLVHLLMLLINHYKPQISTTYGKISCKYALIIYKVRAITQMSFVFQLRNQNA